MSKNIDIVILGDIMLDRYLWGTTSRISPEAPVPVVNLSETEDRLGGAGNVALNIQNTGASVKLFGCIGDDSEGNSLRTLLKKNNIMVDLYTVSSPTTTKSRIMSMGRQLLRVDSEEICSTDVSKEIYCKVIKSIKLAKLVVISDYSKGVITDIKTIIDEAKKQSVKVIIDPKSKNLQMYSSAYLIKPNLKEFKNFDDYDPTKSIYENSLFFQKKYDIEWFVITMGSEGILAVNKSGTKYILNTDSKEVIDVTGAGDTVLSYIAYGIINDYSMQDSLILANKAAGISVGILGSASVKLDNFKFLELNNIFDLSIQDSFVEIHKQENLKKKVVMTNGCFDIIHPGHIEYLRKSRELGDILIVAVNSDSSISSLKGNSRPINNFEYRSKVLSSIESVDYVVEFDENTPEELIKKIKPNILTKGSDYKVSEISGSDFIKSYGGEIILIDLLEDYSTTSVLSKISLTK